MMMKADVLSGFSSLKVCTHYQYKGKRINHVPYATVNQSITPIYKKFDSWEQEIDCVLDINQLPKELNNYIIFLEEKLGVPIVIVSVGPDREQTLVKEKLSSALTS